MAAFTTVAKVDEIPEGTAAAFAVNGRMVAVFNDAGRFLAIDDICPHMGASLATGHVEQGVVTCPWHAWRFNICDNPQIKIDAFEVRVDGDELQVLVPDQDEA